ncbi:uncharacterized protein LOC130992085 [Salvia miltiorrhiza]|uniref:uncharacterized protein LOC130992085 n=1 Tax=Salvia miltiorrhiza TaxID=226208 RepID=UPI0025AD3BCF|nr:uncharacterized protein LOC130992085 [Salvia miltiorrhiza]
MNHPPLCSISRVQEVLPPLFNSTSLDPPPLFDGTTRLYVFYECPFCQRVWIVRNYNVEAWKWIAIRQVDEDEELGLSSRHIIDFWHLSYLNVLECLQLTYYFDFM